MTGLSPLLVHYIDQTYRFGNRLTMKLFCLLLLIAFAAAENCRRTSDCVITKCISSSFDMRCFDDNTCSCVPNRNAYSCNRASDCDESVIGDCGYNDHKWHCVDQYCHCRSIGK